jgi:hypothetical protein
MGLATALSLILQLVQAGFVLGDIVNTVKEMSDAGATDDQIHKYLRDLAHASQDRLEQA